MAIPIVTLLSDYGLTDDFVGVCHGVVAGICPEARVIDITHGIDRHDVRGGAVVLARSLPFLPVGVHVAIVDPDVGAERRAVALGLADGRVLVGPDNGLLWPAAADAGGVLEAIDIARSPHRLEPVSATFHGRDIFVPVAAQLAAGAPLSEAGDPLDPGELHRLELPRPHLSEGLIVAHVIAIDRFGNVQLDAGHEDLAGSGLRLGRAVSLRSHGGTVHRPQFARTFAEVPAGELLLYEDAYRTLAIAVSHGSAAAALGLKVNDEVRIETA
jgi:S-adenosyl-L-methionine hydrolase (adenosine-forming)